MAYQQKKAGVIYSDCYWYDQVHLVKTSGTEEYSQKEKDENQYRSVPQKFSQLRSYRT